MRKLLLLLCVLLVTTFSFGQSMSNYAFTATAGTYTPIAGSTDAIAASASTNDDGYSAVFALPFDFFMNGTRYTHFIANVNGFIRLGQNNSVSSSNPTSLSSSYTNAISTVANTQMICPMWDDLYKLGNSSDKVHYVVEGSAPNRIFIVEWFDIKRNGSGGGAQNFQAQLFEGTGQIQFVYGTCNTTLGGTPSASVGFTNNTGGTSNFISVTDPSTGPKILTTNATVSTTVAQDVIDGTATVSGLTYSFTPPAAPNAPTALATSNATTTGMTLSWTDNAANEAGFAIYRSLDDVTYTFVSTVAANTVTTNVSGLTINTNYYWKVYAFSEGALSTSADVQGATAAAAVPLAGVYSINNALPYVLAHDGTGNFTNFTSAINYLNGEGVSAAVTFNVAAGQTFNESAPAITTTTSTSVNTVTFQRSGVGANPKITPSGSAGTADFGIGIVGADYITFDGIDIEPLNNTVEFGYYVANASTTNGAQFNTIKNTKITMFNTATGIAGIRTAVPSTPASAAGTNSNNTFKNLTIGNAYRSIWFVGNSTNRDEANTVTADPAYVNEAATNTVGYNDLGNITVSASSGMRGIEINGQSNVLVTKSEVRNIVSTNTSSSSDVVGIMCNTTATSSNITISNNLIHDITGAGTTTQVVYGIWFSGACVANVSNVTGNKIYKLTGASTTSGTTRGILYNNSTAAATGNIINNMVYQLANPNNATGAPAIRGIELNSAITVNMYYNTVYLDAAYTGTVSNSFQTTCVYMASSTSTVLDMKNNIFVNNSSTSSTGTLTRAVAFYKSTTTIGTQITTGSNNNLLYAGSPSTKNLLYYGSSGNGAQNLATYITNSADGINNGGGTRESAAVTENPPFLSVSGTYNLHLNTAVATFAEGKGTPISTTVDIDGDTRNATTPDIGADEFTGVAVVPCVDPTAQPTALTVMATGTTTASGSFTAASPAPTNYLVIRTTDNTLATTPVNATTYTVGTNVVFGAGGYVESVGNGTTISSTGLTAGTTYYYWVFSFNNSSCTGGPNYLIAGPASASTTTGSSITSIATGNWEDGGTWSSGVAPTAIDNVTIAATHEVTVNAVAASANSLAINNTGILTVTGSTLTIPTTLSNAGTLNANGGILNVTGAATTGITNAVTTGNFNVAGGTVNLGITNNSFCNRTFTNSGILTVSSGNLNVYGNLNNANGSTFNQSGGIVSVDGNAAGILANSVAAGTNIIGFGTSGTGATLNLTGGSLIVVDPHATTTAVGGTSNGHAFCYWGNGYRSNSTHTVQIGNGVSTDAGGNTSGFQYDIWPGNGYFIAGNLVINAPTGTNRNVTAVYGVGVEKDFTITNGEINSGSIIKVGGNIDLSSPTATLTSTSTVALSLWGSDLTTSSSNAPSTSAQVFTNSGTVRNSLTTPTANFSALLINNTNTTGVTFGTGITNPTVSGAITVTDGKLNANSVTLQGTSSQAVALTAATSSINVTNFTLNNSSGSTLSGSGFVNVTGTATVSAGLLTAGGRLVLKSTMSGTARIAAVAGTLTGNVTTEVYIPGGRRAYRFLGHPFSTALSMSSLTDDIFVTGDGTVDGSAGTTGAGFDATTTNAPSSYWFDQTTNGWKAFMTAADASWTQYAGTRVLVRGDRTQADALTGVAYTPLAVTLDMTGAVNTGNQNIAVSNAGNFHLVSNPYPSPVNIGTVVDATTNIGTMYWVWDANAVSKGAYVPLTVGSGAYNLAMNGAFFVQPTVGTTLAFTEANKTASATANLYRTATASNQLEVQVNYNGGYADKLFVRNNATASTTKEATDGSKLSNPDVNIYAIASTNDQLTLDSRPIANNTIIPVGFTSTLQSNFEIALNSNTLNNGLDVIVKDKFLNVEHTLTTSNPYSFAVTADAASQGVNRFELVFRNSSALPTNFVSVSAVQQGNAIAVNFTTANEQNMSSYEVEESANGNSFTKGTSIKANNTTTANYNWLDATINNGNNYYRIKSIEKNGVVKYSQVVNVRTGTKGAEFAVYPNPVKGGVVNVQLTNIEKGQYSIKIVNSIGQEVAAKTIVHNGGSATQSINIGNVASGTYNMVISNGTTSVTKTVIVE